ncbi:hypothetical protein OG788_27015 [Streptomyces sp. NBC_00647]|uniref:hypothetical protein n=1 Tax=unclassified Streptomyces TaxID=2593676 RepID=UPI00324A9178
MDEKNAGKLQIFAIEERESAAATCVVRCVGGIVRTGQRFDVGRDVIPAGESHGVVTLDWIDRYGRRVDFVDPPHNAKVLFSGEGAPFLKEGATVTASDV